MQLIKDGDRNTRLFHSSIKARGNGNRVFSITDKNGQKHTDMEDTIRAFTEYDEDLLGTKTTSRHTVCSSLIQQGTLVSNEQRDQFISEYQECDVKKALWDIEGDKSPGRMVLGVNFTRING